MCFNDPRSAAGTVFTDCVFYPHNSTGTEGVLHRLQEPAADQLHCALDVSSACSHGLVAANDHDYYSTDSSRTSVVAAHRLSAYEHRVFPS